MTRRLILDNKIKQIYELLSQYPSFAVTFSGGIDSMLLLYLAHQMFPQKVSAVTIKSPTLSKQERIRIDEIVQMLSVEHEYLDMDELSNSKFVCNDKKRCYYCKLDRVLYLQRWAKLNNIAVLLDGSNVDDLSDYRPGMKAVEEVGDKFVSPFLIAGITKSEIRKIAKNMGIAYWDLPSSACLASRIETGISLTYENLQKVEIAEEYLRQYLPGIVRVRHHGALARIEIPPENFAILLNEEIRSKVLKQLNSIGYKSIVLDLYGYQVGSMNTALTGGEK